MPRSEPIYGYPHVRQYIIDRMRGRALRYIEREARRPQNTIQRYLTMQTPPKEIPSLGTLRMVVRALSLDYDPPMTDEKRAEEVHDLWIAFGRDAGYLGEETRLASEERRLLQSYRRAPQELRDGIHRLLGPYVAEESDGSAMAAWQREEGEEDDQPLLPDGHPDLAEDGPTA